MYITYQTKSGKHSSEIKAKHFQDPEDTITDLVTAATEAVMLC